MAADPDRQAQFLRGALDMCLLALLHERPSHAYGLATRLEHRGLEGIGYGTLYPLVTRLRRLGLVEESVVASSLGPPRKVYRLSAAGRLTLTRWAAEWSAGVSVLRALLVDTGALSGTVEEMR